MTGRFLTIHIADHLQTKLFPFLSSYFGLSSSYYYAWINDGGASAANVNFIIGQKFLESYYSVYDTTNSRIGFATAA